MTTPFRQHLARWAGGCGSEACDRALHKCFARGTVPCQVFLCGEAPGATEDVIGQPFVGVAGRLLQAIVDAALPPTVTRCYANVVLCLPVDDEGAKGQPSVEQLTACQPRLEEFIALCKPRLVVAVGALARDQLDPKRMRGIKLAAGVKLIDVVHPAAILRMNLSMQGLAVQRCTVQIRQAWEDVEEATGLVP